MPRKKPAIELTTAEALKRIFPKKAREELYRVGAREGREGLETKEESSITRLVYWSLNLVSS